MGVVYLYLAERYVRDGYVVISSRKLCIFKALDAYIGIGIKEFCYPSSYAINLNTGHNFDFWTHIQRHGADEIAYASRRFKHTSTIEAEMPEALVHGLDYIDRSIMGIEYCIICLSVFFLGKKIF